MTEYVHIIFILPVNYSFTDLELGNYINININIINI